MDLPAGVGEVEGCRHFFTNGGLGSFGRDGSPHRVVDPPLASAPLASRHFLFWRSPAKVVGRELGRCHKKKTPGSLRMPGVRGSLLQLGF